MIFDTHIHLAHPCFNQLRDHLVRQVDFFLECATTYQSIKDVLFLSSKYEQVFSAIGIHPCFCQQLEQDNIEIDEWLYQQYLQYDMKDKIRAIGEIGLDYRKGQYSHKLQLECFSKQLQVAKQLDFPVSIHCIYAAEDVYQQVKLCGINNGILHGCSLSWEMAKKFVDYGFYLGIGSTLTYPNARKIVEVVKNAPLDRLLLETDSPFMLPYQLQDVYNTPKNIYLVANRISTIRNISLENVYQTTYQNARSLLRINN